MVTSDISQCRCNIERPPDKMIVSRELPVMEALNSPEEEVFHFYTAINLNI